MSIENGCDYYYSCNSCAKEDCLVNKQKTKIERLTKEKSQSAETAVEVLEQNLELQKKVDELKEKIMNLKSAMIDRVVGKSYNTMLTTPEDVEEIFGDAYESEFNKFLGQAVKDTAREILKWLKAEVIMTEIPRGSEPCEEDVEAVMWWQIEEHFKKEYGVEVE